MDNIGQIDPLWEVGGITLGTGVEVSTTTAHRTDFITLDENIYLDYSFSSYNLNIFFYDESQNYVTSTNKISSGFTVRSRSDVTYVRFAVNIPEEDNDLLLQFHLNYSTSKPLNTIDLHSEFTQPTFYYGYIANNSSTASLTTYTLTPSYAHAFIELDGTEQFIITGTGGSTARLWAWVDSSGNIITAKASNATVENAVVMPPPDAAYLIINVLIANDYQVLIYKNKSGYLLKETHFNENLFEQGRYNASTGAKVNSSIFIRSKDYLSSNIKYLTITDSTVQACIIRFTKTTEAYNAAQYWITSEQYVPYVFAHDSYVYKIYLSHITQEAEGDFSSILDGVLIFTEEEEQQQEKKDINDKIVYYEKTIANLTNSLQNLYMLTSYNISFANAQAPIYLKNYVDNIQNVHPKVLYLEDGFGGHNYWMAYTPYPYSDEEFENPCIAYSDDGYNWVNIQNNPLNSDPSDGYFSDTHLVYNSTTGQLECWYRYASSDSASITQEIIYRNVSDDGLDWDSAEVIFTSSGYTNKVLSPAILYDSSSAVYHFWCVNNSTDTIDYSTIDESTLTKTDVRSLSFTLTSSSSLRPWHVDVTYENSTYIMLIDTRNSSALGQEMILFLTTSSDNSIYTTPSIILKGNDKGWDKYIYRSCIIKDDSNYKIYYSATNGGSSTIYSTNAIWGIGITESDDLTYWYGK